MSSFCWYFLNIRPFIYWTLNKQSLETWSCVCCYCAYGLFLCFHSLWNISWKRQEIWGGSRTVRCRSQWVKHIKHFIMQNYLLRLQGYLKIKFYKHKSAPPQQCHHTFSLNNFKSEVAGNSNLKTTGNEGVEIAFYWLLKVPFVNPLKDAKDSATLAVKFVNQYSGLEKKLQFHLALGTGSSNFAWTGRVLPGPMPSR